MTPTDQFRAVNEAMRARPQPEQWWHGVIIAGSLGAFVYAAGLIACAFGG